ncbi:MAG: hypothetical protein BWY66_01972 [bacterium ADurb.Bin374]|nr:MAG: hypothetical protein BWY66_01972 [bacterium ADurb.Bin374]
MVVEHQPAFQDVVHAGVLDRGFPHLAAEGPGKPALEHGQQQLPAMHVHDAVDGRVPFFGIVPDLADDQRAGFRRVRSLGQVGQVAEAEVERHVEPPAVDALVAQIRLDHRVRRSVDVFLDVGILEVELGKILDVIPADISAIVFIRELEEGAPLAARVATSLHEHGAAPAHVVEHTIEHETHAAPVQIGRQVGQVGAGPVDRVDCVIIPCVVLVVRQRGEDRIEVDDVDAQFLDIPDTAEKALKIAAPEIDLVRPDAFLLQVGTGFRRFLPVAEPAWRGIQFLLPREVGRRGEPVDDDLVDDGAVAPVGGSGCQFLLTGLVIHVHGRPLGWLGGGAHAGREPDSGDQSDEKKPHEIASL